MREDCEVPGELARLLQQEERPIQPHEELLDTINLGIEIFVIPLDGSLVIMESSLLLRFLLFQWMVTLLLWKVVFCRYFCYSNGW